MKPQNLKKGDKANHQQRGACVLLTDLGAGPNKGTVIRLTSGEVVEASTVYLREIANESKPLPTDSESAGGS